MTNRVSIIGQGYVGLELAMTLCRSGFFVSGVDSNKDRVALLSQGQSPVENVSSEELVEFLEMGTYRATSDFRSIRESSVVVICVPTPLNSEGDIDLKYLEDAVKEISPHISKGTLLINESTSFPGTMRNFILRILEEVQPGVSEELYFGVAPERVSPGNQIPLKEIGRVVAGLDQDSTDKIAAFYRTFCKEVLVVETPEIAEMAKLLENTFRLINISFINEFNILCRKMNIDTRKVIEAASSKPYGFMRFDPSAGVGGHCIPVDPIYLQHAFRLSGLSSKFIQLGYEINQRHPERLFEIVESILAQNGITEKNRILLLGVAYKSGLSDTRESPAEGIAKVLEERGIQYGWIDPRVEEWNGTKQSNAEEKWSAALIVTNQDGLPLNDLIIRGIPIFDFTGMQSSMPSITQI